MGRAAFQYIVVYRGDQPCWLATNTSYCPEPLLIASNDNPPARFVCDREKEKRAKYTSIYTRRRALRAIRRTQKFIESASGSMVADSEFVKKVTSNGGDWRVVPFICPKTQPESK